MRKSFALIITAAALALILSAWLIIASYPRDISFTLPAYAISDELKMKTELEITGKLKKHIFGKCKYSFSGSVVVDAIPYTQKNDAWPVELQFVESDFATDERVLIATGLYNSSDGTPKTRPNGFCTLAATEDFTTLILELGSYKGDFSGWVVAPANNELEADNTLNRFLEKCVYDHRISELRNPCELCSDGAS